MDGANRARLAVERLGKVWQLQKGQVGPDRFPDAMPAAHCGFSWCNAWYA